MVWPTLGSRMAKEQEQELPSQRNITAIINAKMAFWNMKDF